MKIKELANIVEERYGDPARFVANLKIWMHEGNVSQVALAREAGLDPSNLNRWCRGRIFPSMKNMILLDEALERLLEG